MAAPDHPLARRRRVDSEQLAQAEWVLCEAGSGTREASDRWLTGELERVRVALELRSNEAIMRAVLSGLGLGCLSRVAVREWIEQGRLVELRAQLPKMKRTLAMVTHGSKRLGPMAQSFVEHCLRHA